MNQFQKTAQSVMRHNFETMKHYTESRDGFHQDVQNVIIIDNMKKDTVGTLQLVFFCLATVSELLININTGDSLKAKS